MENIVEVMCNAAGQGAYRIHLLGLQQLILHFTHFALCSDYISNIPASAADVGMASVFIDKSAVVFVFNLNQKWL